jgi:DNA-(apurinic or apyrimidinic site) lyase
MLSETTKRLINELAAIGILGARKVEERLDKQFLALQKLYKSSQLTQKQFVVLCTLNALISFQLSCRGEEYWQEFAEYFMHHEIGHGTLTEALRSFLLESRCNKRYRELKLRRLQKAQRVENLLFTSDLEQLYRDMLRLRDLLASAMRQEQHAKTIVFAVKIFGYAMRISGADFVPYPMEIDIPLDFRIQRITQLLGSSEDPISFWRSVARASRVPPLHIDSVLWNIASASYAELEESFKSDQGLLNSLKNIKSLLKL